MQNLVENSRNTESILKQAGITQDQAELFLSYAKSQLENVIRTMRHALEKISDHNIRYEYLARIDALEIAQSYLSVEQLAKELEIPNQKENTFNVR